MKKQVQSHNKWQHCGWIGDQTNYTSQLPHVISMYTYPQQNEDKNQKHLNDTIYFKPEIWP